MTGKALALFLRAAGGAASRFRNLLYRGLGCRIDGYAWLQSVRIPRQWSDIHMENGVALDEGVVLLASGPASRDKIHIGRNVYLNRNTFIDASVSVSIGAETMIGPNCYITDHDHQIQPGKAPGSGGLESRPTQIGERVWLGAAVIVLKGVSIGKGSIVGAGSVVTKDIPEHSVAVGSPAKVVRSVAP